jgi:methionyl-tRNA synthetase
MSEPYYITTAIAYPNGRPHIGHAYEAIATDAIARFQRLMGRDVRLITGTDEHGLKMAQTARNAGRETLEFADEMSSYFRDMCAKLNVSHDCFMRTTDAQHHAASKALWKAMEASGDLYLDRYEGWYSVRDEAYYADGEVTGGDGEQKLSPQGTPVEWTVEESWFFRLSKYQDQLLAHYRDNVDFIRPDSRKNEVLRFVEGGLRDLSVSRTSFDWGVPVPGSPGHVMYVWVDALTTYLSGIGYPNTDGDFSKFWPADVHIIGKDIVRFHAVYWPAFLLSAGLPLPKQVFGHGFILARDGAKMGKSAGNAADPLELAERYGVDQFRYFLLREVSFGQDGSWSEEAIVTRCNSELTNGLGNLAQRCLSMIYKNFDGIIPLGMADMGPEVDALGAHLNAQQAMETLDISRATEHLRSGVDLANKYFAERAPWTDPQSPRGQDALYRTAEAIRRLAIAHRWIIPTSCDLILDQLAVPKGGSYRDFSAILSHQLQPGAKINEPIGVFPRLKVAT